jgi:hypothetical protein
MDVFLHSANGYLVVCTVMELCNRGDLANYLFDKRKRQSPLTEQVQMQHHMLVLVHMLVDPEPGVPTKLAHELTRKI